MNDHPSRVMPGRADIQGLKLLESCSFHWIFDGATRRFRRTPRDASVWPESSGAWTEYHRLEIDDARSCFVVGLDETGTRVLRANDRFAPSRVGGRHPLRPYGGRSPSQTGSNAVSEWGSGCG